MTPKGSDLTAETRMDADLLPGETKVVECLESQLSDEFVLARDLLRLGVALPETKDLNNSSLQHDSVVTILGVFIKACVTFRAIIHLCESGLDRSALPLSRSLFENAMTLSFLSRRRVSLFRFNESKAKPRSPLPLYGKTLTPAFRTALYNAWCLLKEEKTVEGWTRTPGLKRRGSHAHNTLKLVKMEYVADIGTDWETALKRSNTCSGLSISDFARSLGGFYRAWYATIYAEESKSVHQSDLLNYLDCDEAESTFSARWFTSPGSVKVTLVRGASVFYQCISEMHSRFRFDTELVSSARLCADRLILGSSSSMT